MEKDSLRRTSSWRIETQAEPRQLDPQGLDVKALQLHQLVDTQEVVGRQIKITSERQDNSRERARQLRKLATEALEQVFHLEQEKREEVELILAELIQNAFRYSVSGPIWLSMVQTLAKIKNKETCVIDITVANKLGASLEKVEYEGEVPLEEDGLPEVSVHERGEPILDALSIEHGRFQSRRLIGAYAVVGCSLDPSDQGQLTTAA
jgi:hypothetical protein